MAVQYCNYDIKGTLAVTGTSTFTGAATFGSSINMSDNQPINFGGQTMFTHTGSITRIGDNSSSSVLNISGGNATFTGNVSLGDDKDLIFGAATDYKIYHNSTTNVNHISSLIDRQLSINANQVFITNQANTENMARFIADGEVKLFYDNVQKFQTTSAGIEVSGTSSTFAGDITVSGGDITLGGTGRIQGVDTVSASTDAANKAYVDAHVSPAGTYLPLVGGTMSGNIVMGDNDITGIDQLTFSSGTYLTDVSSNYVNLRYASTAAGGILVSDGDGTTQGYLYADGGATSNFGLLHGSGSWAVRCKELAEVELRYNNTARLQTINDGVYVAGKLGIGTSNPDAYGYSYAEDLVIYGGASASDGAGITIAGNGKRYGIIAFGDAADDNAGEIFYDHDVNAMYFRTNSSNSVVFINSAGKVTAGAATGSSDGSSTLTTKGYVDNAVAGVPQGDITNVSTTSPITGGGSSGSVTIAHANSGVTATTYTAATIAVNATGHITSASSNTIPTNNNQLTNGSGYITAGSTNTLTNKSGNISQWTNDSGYITSSSLPTVNNATITIAAGTNLTTGGNFTTNQGSNETITINMATGGVGAGTYGSTSNSTKIDNITVDAYGRVTAVTTGATGQVDTVQDDGGSTINVSGSSTARTVAAVTGTVNLSSANLATGAQIQTAINTAVTGVLKYDGVWNASTNSPTLTSGSGTVGEYYIVSVAGSTNLDGITDWAVGDWAVFSDQATDAWQKIDNTQVGNVTGSGSSGRVAVWNGASNITSDTGLTFNTSTNLLTIGGQVNWSGGSSAESNDAYDNTITGFSDSGSSTITLTLTQRDGGTLTTSFSNPQGTTTADNSQTFTNKSGNISQWTNNSGYITSSSVGNGQIDGRTSGLGLSGSMDATANQSGNTTFTVTSNATTSSTASTIAYRDSAGDISSRLFRSEYGNESTISGGIVFRVNNTTDNYMRTCSSPTAIRNFIGAASSSVVSGVTSVATAGSVNGLTLTGGTITSTGTITLGGTLSISNGDWSGTDLSVANGGTGASTASAARTNLGVVNDTGTPAILSNGSSPSLNSGISAAEVRTLIGAGTSSTTGTVTGTGVDNRLALWNGTTAIDSDSDFYVDGDTIFTTNLEASGNISVTGNINITTDILPVNTGASDLGTSSKRFGSLFVNGISVSTLTPANIELQGNIKLLNKAQTAYIDFAARNVSGSETVVDLTNVGSATFSSTLSVSGDTTFESGVVKKGSGGYYLNTSAGAFRAAFWDNGTDTRIFADGDGSTAAIIIDSGNTTFAGDITVSGGDISLGSGTGRIQGIDTVSAGTDAANKDYVDTAVGTVPVGTVTSVSSSTTSQLTVSQSSPAPALSIVTAAVANGGTGLATGNQIYDWGVAAFAPIVSGGYLPLSGGTMTGDLRLNNSVNLKLGTSSGLEIYHTGMLGVFDNLTGNVYHTQWQDDGDMYFQNDRGDGNVANFFYLDGGLTDNVNTLGATVFPDKSKIFMGTSNDLQIYHDGSNSYIQDGGTGNLSICGTQVDILNPDASEYKARFLTDGAVELYYNNSKKMETTVNGIALPQGNNASPSISRDGDNNTGMYWGASDELNFSTAGINRLIIDSNGLTVNGNVSLDEDVILGASSSIVLDDTPTASTASGSGTIVKWSVSVSVTAGTLYVIKSDGGWTTADADSEAKSTAMAAIALGSNATSGMLLQGFFYKASHGFAIGSPLYISNTAGAFTNSRPTGTGDYVRIIGYATSTNYIYFDPDKTWVKID